MFININRHCAFAHVSGVWWPALGSYQNVPGEKWQSHCSEKVGEPDLSDGVPRSRKQNVAFHVDETNERRTKALEWQFKEEHAEYGDAHVIDANCLDRCVPLHNPKLRSHTRHQPKKMQARHTIEETCSWHREAAS